MPHPPPRTPTQPTLSFVPQAGDDKQAAASGMQGMQAMQGMQGMQMPFFAPPGFFPSPMMPVRDAGQGCTFWPLYEARRQGGNASYLSRKLHESGGCTLSQHHVPLRTTHPASRPAPPHPSPGR